MNPLNLFDLSKFSDLFEENKTIRYLTYGAGAIIGIWILGKAAKLLEDAASNFKDLHNSLKS